MSKHLVIVESPAKARTIERYLGKEYVVRSSFGHIRDLPKKGLSIDIDHNFEPTYEVSSDKKKVVSDLKRSAKEVDDVWLASDEDREGEAIAWHLTQVLGLDPKHVKRIVFHEITKPAIDSAVKNPRTIDQSLVDAQQARRVLDRLVGYELSPILWKKVRGGLSAGRVQSVAVRLIVERERQIRNFTASSTYKVTATFKTSSGDLSAELSEKLDTIDKARWLLKDCLNDTFSVANITKKPSRRNPAAPFTTSSLQQEAFRKLSFSVKQTMLLAQRLYEAGYITYMRTDSTNLSQLAQQAIANYVTKEFGALYLSKREYKTKTLRAQEAHEAIRPTDVTHTKQGNDTQQQKLYQLIWQRTIASQMSPAQLDRTEITINRKLGPELFIAKGEILTFAGYYKVFGRAKDDTLLPPLKPAQKLKLEELIASETFSKPAARYSEASLVKKLEDLGIGRPSTYAPTISTIQSRGYVEKGDLGGKERSINQLVLSNRKINEIKVSEITGADKNKLLPTYLAEVTTDFLIKYFANIVDYDFTAHVEQDFDNIAEGKQQWRSMIKDFYKDFHPLVIKSEKASRAEASQARLLGKDAKTNQPIYARFGRYGPMLQRGESESETKPDFAPLPADTTIDSVTFDQAVDMFTLPKAVGKTSDGQEIRANIGRFGPYIQVGKLFVSIKPLDPLSITEAQARELYEKKLSQQNNKIVKEFSNSLKIANGPYGPYVTNGKKNARIPKEQDPAKLTKVEAQKLLAKTKPKRRSSRFSSF